MDATSHQLSLYSTVSGCLRTGEAMTWQPDAEGLEHPEEMLVFSLCQKGEETVIWCWRSTAGVTEVPGWMHSPARGEESRQSTMASPTRLYTWATTGRCHSVELRSFPYRPTHRRVYSWIPDPIKFTIKIGHLRGISYHPLISELGILGTRLRLPRTGQLLE